jgi:hypothetical protein
MREVHEQLFDRMRDENTRPPKSPEWRELEAELEAHGIETTDLGIFSSVVPTRFDYEAAAAILVEWLPRVRDQSRRRSLHGRSQG